MTLRVLVMILLAGTLTISACGKKGRPQPPSKAKAEASQQTGPENNQEETE